MGDDQSQPRSDDLARYHRQMLLPDIGETGQLRLRDAHALVVGCGALGCGIIDALARAGVGTLSIIDRDIVELTNLQRQVLYAEADVRQAMPKAQAAKARVHEINATVTVRAIVDDFNYRNAESFITGVDVLLDGLDNFDTRYLLNDLAVKHGIPYIYGGAVATTGMSAIFLPDEVDTPCLRCLFPDPPPVGSTQTCDTVGVLGTVVNMITAHQATQAIKLLTGNRTRLDRSLLSIDAWHNEHRRFDITNARQADCPCCGQRRWEYLSGECGSVLTNLCGRNSVQITPPPGAAAAIDLPACAQRLAPHGTFTTNRFLLKGTFTHERDEHGQPLELTVFSNGRAIITGTERMDVARSLYSKYIGA
jgi:molybdopterin/thiamine biosynthesis adenylyltransferase